MINLITLSSFFGSYWGRVKVKNGNKFESGITDNNLLTSSLLISSSANIGIFVDVVLFRVGFDAVVNVDAEVLVRATVGFAGYGDLLGGKVVYKDG